MSEMYISQNTVVDGFVSVPIGGVPVIRIDVNDLGNYVYSSSIVNFLRCGCPKVQILIMNSGTVDFQTGIDNKIYVLMKDYLRPLQLDKEVFSYSISLPVITITRH